MPRHPASLQDAGLVLRISPGRWSMAPQPSPYPVASWLTDPYPSYVSLYTALSRRGVITKTLRTPVGTFSVHRLQPELFGGYEERNGERLATVETAVFDRLIAELVDTAVLVDEDLDELASTFLWSDRFRFEYPARWLGSEWISIDLEGPEGPVSIPLGRVDPDSTVASERDIAPPLRRWAAARVLRTDPRTLNELRARAAELGPIDGGAITSGVLDAVDVLDASEARMAIELGLGWPRGSIRILALDVLAATDPEDASRRAAADPDRKVRAWSPARFSRGSGPGPDGGEAGRHDVLGAQAELFPE